MGGRSTGGRGERLSLGGGCLGGLGSSYAHAGLREMWGSAGEGKLDRGNLMGEGDWNLCCS